MSAARNPLHVQLSAKMRKAKRDEQAAHGAELLQSRQEMIRRHNEQIQAKRAAEKERQRLAKLERQRIKAEKQRMREEQQRITLARTNMLLQKQRNLEGIMFGHVTQPLQVQEPVHVTWQRQLSDPEAAAEGKHFWLRLHQLSKQSESNTAPKAENANSHSQTVEVRTCIDSFSTARMQGYGQHCLIIVSRVLLFIRRLLHRG